MEKTIYKLTLVSVSGRAKFMMMPVKVRTDKQGQRAYGSARLPLSAIQEVFHVPPGHCFIIGR